MIEVGPQRAQIKVIIKNARFNAFYSVLSKVMDLIDHFITHEVVETF